MKIFVFSSLVGHELASKTQAARLREEVLSPDQAVVLDFSGVRVMSYTFAEEFFGKLVQDHGADSLGTRFRIRNMNSKLQGVLNGVLQRGSGKKAA